MKRVPFKKFTQQEHQTWKTLFEQHAFNRESRIVPMFKEGIQLLGMSSDKIPELSEVNEKLGRLTGFQGVPVEGLEGPESFFPMLERREFPVGNFIRDAKDLSYTPAPDIFHDLYGHIPFYANKRYADFSHAFGVEACNYLDKPKILRRFERVFWFTMEFGLIETPAGRRIFGAGIASSLGECEYSLSSKPKVLPYDPKVAAEQEFRIDVMQEILFAIQSEQQLYDSLNKIAFV